MMYEPVLDTLFLPVRNGAFYDTALADAGHAGDVLFLNAQLHPALNALKPFCQQSFKPYVNRLQDAGFSCVADIPCDQRFDIIFIHLPKNQIAAEGLIAHGYEMLNIGGALVCAADNKAGGTRLPKTFKKLGFEDYVQDSKNKARVIWVRKQDGSVSTALKNACEKYQPQAIADGHFTSMPGIYGWDKIDKGSMLLAQNLPGDLKGAVADFGCGYGYLSAALLQHDKIKSLTAIDADWQALQMCRQNCGDDGRACFEWEDLTGNPYKARFDSIVMNPPFHEGKRSDPQIGQKFIQSAYEALKPRGDLWMVANTHLPYEGILEGLFFRYTRIAQAQGFKLLHAQK